jgi:integrase
VSVSLQAQIQLLEEAARAELVGTTWHDLRHHHASVLLSSWVSPALVAERLGHDIQTLLRTYAVLQVYQYSSE